ncbi:TetR/AcrR family transcriptional regulator [Gemmatimonadota bacterium]
MTTWRQKQAEELKEKLYSCAIELFQELGYESTPIDRITSKAGVAKGTFFNYFPGKDHVLALWYQRTTLNVLQRCRESAFPSTEEAICTLAAGLAQSGMQEAELYAAKTRNWSRTVSSEEDVLDAALLDYLAIHLEEGRRQGELDDSIEVRFFAELILALMTGTARNWVIQECGFDLNNILTSRVRFVFTLARSREQAGEPRSVHQS